MRHKQLWLTAAVMTMLGTNMSFAAVQIVDNSIAEDNQSISTGINSIAVETLHANGIIQGYPDGTFKGDQPMSRSEYAKMIYELAEKLTTPNN